MAVLARTLLASCLVVVLAPGCSRQVDGSAFRAAPEWGAPDSAQAVDVDALMLDQSQMRAITGAGDDLTIIPSMDGTSPVDIDTLAQTAPVPCRFIFNETEVFGPVFERFHKTTYQDPPKGALISQGAASYRDPGTARRAFDDLIERVKGCSSTPFGPMFVGEWTADTESARTRAGGCGRDYRSKASVLIEVTFCGFGESVPGIVMTNIASKVPG
jgi:hypothetical protein